MTQPLSQGLWGVLATPFDDGLDVDLDSLRNEVASFAADGACGLVALGVFGEAASLDPDEANSVAHTVASSTDLPFVLGLSERDPDAVVEQARRLLDAVPRPPVALMAQIGDADPAAAAASLRRLHDATGVGILIQDYPVVSGVSVTDEQVVEIVSACPFAVGVKSETPPTSVAVAHLVSKLDVPVFGGLGGVGLLDELAAGSAGAMTGFSHPAALAAVLPRSPRRRLRRRPRRVGAVASARQLRGTATGGPVDPQGTAATARRDRFRSRAPARAARCRTR